MEKKYLAICARYLEEENYNRPLIKLISTLPIPTSSSGKTISEIISKNILISEELKLNFMGIATDEGSNMVGPEQGVGQRLKELHPHIVNATDICHVLNNTFTKALKAMPQEQPLRIYVIISIEALKDVRHLEKCKLI